MQLDEGLLKLEVDSEKKDEPSEQALNRVKVALRSYDLSTEDKLKENKAHLNSIEYYLNSPQYSEDLFIIVKALETGAVKAQSGELNKIEEQILEKLAANTAVSEISDYALQKLIGRFIEKDDKNFTYKENRSWADFRREYPQVINYLTKLANEKNIASAKLQLVKAYYYGFGNTKPNLLLALNYFKEILNTPLTKFPVLSFIQLAICDKQILKNIFTALEGILRDPVLCFEFINEKLFAVQMDLDSEEYLFLQYLMPVFIDACLNLAGSKIWKNPLWSREDYRQLLESIGFHLLGIPESCFELNDAQQQDIQGSSNLKFKQILPYAALGFSGKGQDLLILIFKSMMGREHSQEASLVELIQSDPDKFIVALNDSGLLEELLKLKGDNIDPDNYYNVKLSEITAIIIEQLLLLFGKTSDKKYIIKASELAKYNKSYCEIFYKLIDGLPERFEGKFPLETNQYRYDGITIILDIQNALNELYSSKFATDYQEIRKKIISVKLNSYSSDNMSSLSSEVVEELANLGDDRAIKELKKRARMLPTDAKGIDSAANAMLALAKIYLKEKIQAKNNNNNENIKEARDLLERVMPCRPEARILLADIYIEDGEINKIAKLLDDRRFFEFFLNNSMVKVCSLLDYHPELAENPQNALVFVKLWILALNLKIGAPFTPNRFTTNDIWTRKWDFKNDKQTLEAKMKEQLPVLLQAALKTNNKEASIYQAIVTNNTSFETITEFLPIDAILAEKLIKLFNEFGKRTDFKNRDYGQTLSELLEGTTLTKSQQDLLFILYCLLRDGGVEIAKTSELILIKLFLQIRQNNPDYIAVDSIINRFLSFKDPLIMNGIELEGYTMLINALNIMRQKSPVPILELPLELKVCAYKSPNDDLINDIENIVSAYFYKSKNGSIFYLFAFLADVYFQRSNIQLGIDYLKKALFFFNMPKPVPKNDNNLSDLRDEVSLFFNLTVKYKEELSLSDYDYTLHTIMATHFIDDGKIELGLECLNRALADFDKNIVKENSSDTIIKMFKLAYENKLLDIAKVINCLSKKEETLKNDIVYKLLLKLCQGQLCGEELLTSFMADEYFKKYLDDFIRFMQDKAIFGSEVAELYLRNNHLNIPSVRATLGEISLVRGEYKEAALLCFMSKEVRSLISITTASKLISNKEVFSYMSQYHSDMLIATLVELLPKLLEEFKSKESAPANYKLFADQQEDLKIMLENAEVESIVKLMHSELVEFIDMDHFKKIYNDKLKNVNIYGFSANEVNNNNNSKIKLSDKKYTFFASCKQVQGKTVSPIDYFKARLDFIISAVIKTKKNVDVLQQLKSLKQRAERINTIAELKYLTEKLLSNMHFYEQRGNLDILLTQLKNPEYNDELSGSSYKLN
jgi:hypothetical protein